LLNSNPEYAKLESEINSWQSQSQGHPQWPNLRDQFKKISETEEYKKLFATFNKTIKQLDNELTGGIPPTQSVGMKVLRPSC